MKQVLLSILITFFSVTLFAQHESFYDFSTTTIEGRAYPFSQLKGKKVIIVNVDIYDNVAPDYAILQEFYNQYSDSNVVVLGFPTDDFSSIHSQQSYDDTTYRLLDYDVTFPMMQKTNVIGDNISPLYQWLTQKSLNGKEDATIIGNFQKFLINEKGEWIATLAPDESLFNINVQNWIQND